MANSPVSRSGRQRVANVERDIPQAHTFVVGNVVYLEDADGLWKKATASDVTKLGLYVVSRVAGANNFSIATAGVVSGIQAATVVGGGSLSVGQFYYVSDVIGQEGMVTATEPSISNLIYQAFTATSAFVLPFRPALLGSASDPLIANNITTSMTNLPLNLKPNGTGSVVIYGVEGTVVNASFASSGAATIGPMSAIGGSTFPGHRIIGRTNGSAALAGCVGEVIYSAPVTTSGGSTGSGVTLGTLPLTAGSWIVYVHGSLKANFDSDGSVGWTIYPTTDWSLSPTEENQFDAIEFGAAGGRHHIKLVADTYGSLAPQSVRSADTNTLRLNLAAVTTYYLRAAYSSSVTDVSLRAYFYAVRIG